MKILFYYPQHFNRSAQGTNPFFDELLKACDEAGSSYDLMEEPDGGTDKPRNPQAKKADGFFRFVWFLRNVAKLFSRDLYRREEIAAKMLNVLTFGKYRYDKYITISGSMLHLFAALNPKAEVYDMQHGILTNHHSTFRDKKNKLLPQFYKKQLHWMVWGDGYKELFCRGEELLLSYRVHVVGYPCEQSSFDTCTKGKNIILFSLQLISEWGDKLILQKQMLDEHLSMLQDCGCKILLKHHPRYNNAISIDDILAKYSNVELTTDRLEDLAPRTLLHVTYHSTTAFEYAAHSVPTFIMSSSSFPLSQNFLNTEFYYPLFIDEKIDKIIQYLRVEDNYRKTMKTVNEWYNRFYTPFDKEAFLKLLK